MTYDALRQFADSWGLVILTLIFVFVLFWINRPGSRALYREQADIPFKHDKEGD